MKHKISFKLFSVIFLASLLVAMAGCGGGGGGGGDDSQGDIDANAAISVDPADFDFLTLTADNSALPQEFVIQSSGSADLRISSIAFSNATAFTLDLDPAQDPCGPLVRQANPLKSGERCRFRVEFNPPRENSDEFEKALVIQSNATVPQFPVVVSGRYEPTSQINVAISQIDACERPDLDATVYVSVTDQADFPIKGLTIDNFLLREQPTDGNLVDVIVESLGFVDQTGLSVSLLMDYSGSIVARDLLNMETAATTFVRRLQENDEAEVIKYDSESFTMQDFTSDLALLETAINEAPPLDRGGTALYDAIVAATTERTDSDRSQGRKAIIILTDGEDNESDKEIGEAIAAAEADGIPLFTVGFGDENSDVLQRLADDTGGVYFASEASDNLEAIYVKLADLLFEDQYVLTYTSELPRVESGSLQVEVTAFETSDTDGRAIPACE